MSELSRLLPRGEEDTDLLCVEVSALGQAPVPATILPRVSCDGWQQQEKQEVFRDSSADQAHEEFLTSLLAKTNAYRPLETSWQVMEDAEFLDMRGAVVNWFAKVSVSYDFANETVVAALSHFDRYVSLTVTPVNDHMLLQLAAYVALLIASKMGETCPLRMRSLANLTGRMFTPLQVKQLEMDMISKLNFRSHYLKRARARTCWFRHAPYTLAVAALTTAYNSMGLGKERRRLLRECDARARAVTGRGVDVHGVAACADAMVSDERAAATAAAAAAAASGHARGSTESPVCGGSNTAAKDGWGSPTGVAQGAELLQKAAFSAVGVRGDQGIGSGGGGSGVPLVEDFSPLTTFSPHGAVTTKAVASHVVAGRRVVRRVSSSPRGGGAAAARPPRVSTSPWDIAAPPLPARAGPEPRRVSTSPLDVERVAPRRAPVVAVQAYPDLPDASRRQSVGVGGGGGQKRRLHQSSGSCFVPCARRRRSVEGKDVRRVEVADAGGSVGGERVEEDAAGRGYHGGEYLQGSIAEGLDQRQQGCAQAPAARGRQQQQQQQREGGGVDSKPVGQQQSQTTAL
ncbi:cyclin A-like protein [Ectocarpus siliculosus]|uniref:Cyclin A-like protein n=1 Tax=Ectocarpus siliculosus TaxID=2880 RepID=D8LFC1_ECTSI|nr:cyclin A-like protein [Ectocarpus siliculosus]|eukprot:CBN75581.1 cyclin A-like protein [Ectocarpus siliculosus]